MLDLQRFQPCLLLAMPQLQDPNFARSVIVLAEYKPEGAFGLVVNRPLTLKLGEVQSPNVQIAERFHAAPLWYGGPVNPNQAILLATAQQGRVGQAASGGDITPTGTQQTKLLADGVTLTSAQAMVEGSAPSWIGPEFKILVGHAGWSGQQLDQELAISSWLVVPLSKDLIFSEPTAMWERAVRSLGVDPSTLQVPPSVVKH